MVTATAGPCPQPAVILMESIKKQLAMMDKLIRNQTQEAITNEKIENAGTFIDTYA